LIGAVRGGRVLNPMTPDEAARAGLETHIDHFRIEAAGKNNLSRSAPHATWLRRVGVEIGNGDEVAVVEPWNWPDAFDGVSVRDALRIYSLVGSANPQLRYSSQSENWVGKLVADQLDLDINDPAHRSRINSII